MKKIILASASPRRQALLQQASIPFEVVISNVDEETSSELSPYDVVKSLSTKKAMKILEKIQEPAIIIAADTVVFIHGKILGKPSDEKHAFEMLKSLQGQTHSVYTGVSIINLTEGGYELKNIVDNTSVNMRTLTDSEIWAYIKTCEPFDKAGGYAIQGKGSILIEKIDGDYNTVVGLPLVKVFLAMKDFGIDLQSFWQLN